MEKIASILQQAHDLLTPENWIKGSYFSFNGKNFCGCSHGVVQTLVNPKCGALIDFSKTNVLKLSVAALDALAEAALAEAALGATAGAAARAAEGVIEGSDLLLVLEYVPCVGATVMFDAASSKVWNSRPDWVKNSSDYGSLDAHFIMGMVGLTPTFNDDPGTTFPMIKEKFKEAIKLAESLNV